MRRSFTVRTWSMVAAVLVVGLVMPSGDDFRACGTLILVAMAMGVAYACGRIEADQ